MTLDLTNAVPITATHSDKFQISIGINQKYIFPKKIAIFLLIFLSSNVCCTSIHSIHTKNNEVLQLEKDSSNRLWVGPPDFWKLNKRHVVN